MTDFLLNQNALAQAHKQGHRFFIRIESGKAAFDFAELIVEQGGA